MHEAFDAQPDRKIQEVVDGCQDNPSTPVHVPPLCLQSKCCTPSLVLILSISASLTNYTVASEAE